jgi:hypothetical protein
MDRQGTCEIPLTSTSGNAGTGRRLNNGPGLISALHAYQERLGEHEDGGSLWGLQPKP